MDVRGPEPTGLTDLAYRA